MLEPCLHCCRPARTHARGLCCHCYNTLPKRIRSGYHTPHAKRGQKGLASVNHDLPEDPAPTKELPGTEAKILIMCWRATHHLSVFSHGDFRITRITAMRD